MVSMEAQMQTVADVFLGDFFFEQMLFFFLTFATFFYI
ncbi:putative membrane protein [Microcystis aeruginosa TAIHU98]|uniref:Putative membrane protein n=1 Tax=Microcystis aeruginosa TAIHU98 TaxID=1134457 RepID=L7E3S9_MICAE|nr:putative membrane protein [Microcystis aeruginosa TAIHU98]